MKKIMKKEDLIVVQLEPSIKQIVEREYRNLVNINRIPGSPYNPREDGYLIVIEKTDTDIHIQQEFGKPFNTIIWEGIHKEHNCFIGVVLFNNQFGITVIIPDSAWLKWEWRNIIQNNLNQR